MIKNFEYFAPKTIEEAISLLARYKDESKIIAGGQSMLILMRQGLIAPEYVIDIKSISAMDYINFDENEGLRIGALTPHRAIETSPLIRDGFSVLSEMEQNVASVETRNWGTIGGNLCHADPAGDPAPVFIALKGKLKLVSSNGERTVAIDDFFKDYFETALRDEEILTEIQVPNPPPRTGTAYRKFSILQGDYALVSAAVSITLSSKDETCSDARIVLGAAASVPRRAERAEKVLIGKKIKDSLLQEAGKAASEEASPISDMNASEEYRREVIEVLVKQVAAEDWKRDKQT